MNPCTLGSCQRSLLEVVVRSCKPVFLADGLNPDNVKEAVSTVEPFGIDLCSGVRSNNRLNPELLDKFTTNVWC